MKKLKLINFPEIVEAVKKSGWKPPVEELGNGLYKLPGGAITGKNGVKMFMELLAKEYGKNSNV